MAIQCGILEPLSMKKHVEKCLWVQKYGAAHLHRLLKDRHRHYGLLKAWLFSSRSISSNKAKPPHLLLQNHGTACSKFQYKPSHKGGVQLTYATPPALLLQYYLLLKSYFSSGQPLFPISWQKMEIHRTEQKLLPRKYLNWTAPNCGFLQHLYPQRMIWNPLHIS